LQIQVLEIVKLLHAMSLILQFRRRFRITWSWDIHLEA